MSKKVFGHSEHSEESCPRREILRFSQDEEILRSE